MKISVNSFEPVVVFDKEQSYAVSGMTSLEGDAFFKIRSDVAATVSIMATIFTVQIVNLDRQIIGELQDQPDSHGRNYKMIQTTGTEFITSGTSNEIVGNASVISFWDPELKSVKTIYIQN